MARGFHGHHTEKTKELCRLANLGKHSSPATEFKKGSVPWNKGLSYRHRNKGQFPRGNRPKNWLPVGTITIRMDVTGKAYHLIKIAEPKKWQYLSRHVWENAKGREVPPGLIIYHLDGISLNDDPKNLACITRALHIVFCKMDIEEFEENRRKASSKRRQDNDAKMEIQERTAQA